MTLSRRNLLLSATGLAAGSLFLPSRTRAEPATPPKRLLVVLTQHGTVYEEWKMRRAGLPDGSGKERPAPEADWEFPLDDADPLSFSRILRPLHGLREKLLVLDGLSMATALADRGDRATHGFGLAHALTATRALPQAVDTFAGGVSVDQVIADHVARPDRFRSLEIVTGSASPMAYRTPGVPLPFAWEPRGLYERLFGLPSGDAHLDRLRARRKSVLDGVRREFEAVVPAMSGEDRRKLELHRDLVRDLENRVDSVASAACTRPEVAASGAFTPGNYAPTTDAFHHLVAAAFACDLTRVVTLHHDTIPAEVLGEKGDTHNDFAHNADTDARARDVMVRYSTLHAQQVADLARLLDGIPEGDGTVLDHTAIVWMADVSKGTHSFVDWPVVIAGGLSGALRTGRYLRYMPTTPTPMPHPVDAHGDLFVGAPHSHLLVSLCQGMGLDVDRFGQTELQSTPVAGNPSQRIDLTGPLPRLA